MKQKRVNLALAGAVTVILVAVLAVVFNGGITTHGSGAWSTSSSSTPSGLAASTTMVSSSTTSTNAQESTASTTARVAAARVYGTILGTDQYGSGVYTIPIPGATVTVTSAANSTIIATGVSDSNGDYSLSIPSPTGQPLTAQPYIIRVHQSNWNNGTSASMLIYLFWGYGTSSDFKNNMYLTNPNSTSTTMQETFET